jgi:DNA-binding winged helix-turn-helix (wHTH) protein/tetratricopeptide (TPR) repeat protein
MELRERPVYRIGEFELTPAQAMLDRSGQTIPLRAKTLQVLLHLVDHADRFVNKEELFGKIWPDTAVTDDALSQCIADLRKAFADDSKSPSYILTKPRVGYRLIAPVTVSVRTTPARAAEPAPEPAATTPRRNWPLSIGLGAVLLLAVMGGGAWLMRDRATSVSATGKRAVAVMFFENRTSNAELDWFREGLADMLITGLSRSPELLVLSRGQMHALLSGASAASGQPPLMEIARRSNSDRVVTGAFTALERAIRVDIQVLNAGDGSVIGGESLTVANEDELLTRIDLLTSRVALRLGAVTPSGSAPVTTSLEAFRNYSLALERAAGFQNTEAIELLRRAIVLDPEFAMAHARIGYVHAVTWNLAEAARPHLERAFKLIDRLTPLDRLYVTAWYWIAHQDYQRATGGFRELIADYPNEIEAYESLGDLLRGENRHADALSVLAQAIAIDAKSAPILRLRAGIQAQLRQHDQAIASARAASELLPNEPAVHDELGEVLAWAGRVGEAADAYHRAMALNPRFERAIVHLANLHFQTGRYREAGRLYQQFIEIAPSDLERGRGWGRVAWLRICQEDWAGARQAASLERKFDPTGVWNSIALALRTNDSASLRSLEPGIAQFPYTSRGSRTSPRYRMFFDGYLAVKTGKVEEGLRLLRDLQRFAPPYWSMETYEDALAQALADLGRTGEAIIEYQRVIGVQPHLARAHYQLAKLYERQGEHREAQTKYRDFLALWTGADPDLRSMIAARAALNASSQPGY